MVKKFLLRMAMIIPAIVVIAGSYITYSTIFVVPSELKVWGEDGADFLSVWQMSRDDPADYRFIAEHFWGVPHDFSTYWGSYNGAWGDYLEKVPLREIGVGTYYLVLDVVRKGIHQVAGIQVGMHILMPFITKLLTFLGLLAVYVHTNKRFGMISGLAVLLVLVIPVGVWRLGNTAWSEGLLRPLFLILLWIILEWTNGRSDRRRRLLSSFLCMGCVLLMVHVKN